MSELSAVRDVLARLPDEVRDEIRARAAIYNISLAAALSQVADEVRDRKARKALASDVAALQSRLTDEADRDVLSRVSLLIRGELEGR